MDGIDETLTGRRARRELSFTSPNGRERANCRCCNIDVGFTKYASNIQLLVAAEDAILVEGDAPVTRKISLDVRPRGNAVVQIDQAGDLALERLPALRKCIEQPLD